MKRRLFLAAGAVASSGVAANAGTLSKVGHYVHFQTLNATQKTQLGNFQNDLYIGLADKPNGKRISQEACRINSIVSRTEKNGDYELVFLNDRNTKITLSHRGGNARVLVHA